MGSSSGGRLFANGFGGVLVLEKTSRGKVAHRAGPTLRYKRPSAWLNDGRYRHWLRCGFFGYRWSSVMWLTSGSRGIAVFVRHRVPDLRR